MKAGYKFTPEQCLNLSRSHMGQRAWNTGIRIVKCDHPAKLYRRMPSGQKVCLGCKRESGAKYRNRNRQKIRVASRFGRYKISRDQFNAAWKLQKGQCAICSKKLGRHTSKNPRCHIDHNHRTAQVRGLLCRSCNTAIGLFADSISSLRRAILYLERPTFRAFGENTE